MNEVTTPNRPCPDCSKQVFPGGQHTCVYCKKFILTIYEECSVLLPDEEEDGLRMCIKCSLEKQHQVIFSLIFFHFIF